MTQAHTTLALSSRSNPITGASFFLEVNASPSQLAQSPTALTEQMLNAQTNAALRDASDQRCTTNDVFIVFEVLQWREADTKSIPTHT
eukprot:4479704-Amphidinium_carterae.1